MPLPSQLEGVHGESQRRKTDTPAGFGADYGKLLAAKMLLLDRNFAILRNCYELIIIMDDR